MFLPHDISLLVSVPLAPHAHSTLLLDLAADAAMPEDVDMSDSPQPAAAADATAPAPALSTLHREYPGPLTYLTAPFLQNPSSASGAAALSGR